MKRSFSSKLTKHQNIETNQKGKKNLEKRNKHLFEAMNPFELKKIEEKINNQCKRNENTIGRFKDLMEFKKRVGKVRRTPKL